MKKLSRIVIACLAAGLLVATLSACQSGTTEMTKMSDAPVADSGLVPDARSTGNPPLIPHEVDDAEGAAVCQECHRTGEDGAPKYPEWHATLVDCGQCHVPMVEGNATFKPQY